jgi:hypothetical protein
MTKQQYNYEYLQHFCKDNAIKLENDYSKEKITRDTIVRGKCKSEGCVGVFEKNFRCLTKIQNFGCNVCAKEIRKERVIKTCKQKYGVSHSLQVNEFREKGKNTNLEKYGVEFSLQSTDIRNKGNDTKNIKYGDRNFNNREKYITTNVEKYGVENPSQNDEIKQKKKETCFKNHGVEHPLQNKKIKEQIKETNVEKYGVENPSQNDEIKQKKKETCFKNHGVEHPMQNPKILEKSFNSSHRIKDYFLPSGIILKIQGYEHYALDEILKNGIFEEDIVNGCSNVPEIWYNGLDNQIHRYYVDLYIPTQNKCIEVKSDYTFNCDTDTIILKQEAVKKAGYLCEIWVYNNNGEKVECHK